MQSASGSGSVPPRPRSRSHQGGAPAQAYLDPQGIASLDFAALETRWAPGTAGPTGDRSRGGASRAARKTFHWPASRPKRVRSVSVSSARTSALSRTNSLTDRRDKLAADLKLVLRLRRASAVELGSSVDLSPVMLLNLLGFVSSIPRLPDNVMTKRERLGQPSSSRECRLSES